MILSGTFTFEGPRTRVWDILQDPDVLAKARKELPIDPKKLNPMVS